MLCNTWHGDLRYNFLEQHKLRREYQSIVQCKRVDANEDISFVVVSPSS